MAVFKGWDWDVTVQAAGSLFAGCAVLCLVLVEPVLCLAFMADF